LISVTTMSKIRDISTCAGILCEVVTVKHDQI